MGRKRYRDPLEPRADRIAGPALYRWMFNNGISPSQLAEEVFVEPETARGWIRGRRYAPAKLEKLINRAAEASKLPRWGERWPVKAEPIPEAAPAHAPPPFATVATPQACECGHPLKSDGVCGNLACPYTDDDTE